MVRFYADEQFPKDVTVCLRSLGYDVLTVTENPDFDRLAVKIHEAVSQFNSLQGQLIRIYRDSKN